MDDEVAITLTGEEFQRLLLLMGYAAGSANRDHNKSLAFNFMRVANAVNRDNPRWRPYNPPEEQVTSKDIAAALRKLLDEVEPMDPETTRVIQ